VMRMRLPLMVAAVAVLACGCAGCSRHGEIDPKLEKAVLDGDWDEVLALAEAAHERDPESVVASWLMVEAHRRLGEPHLAWEAFARLRDQQQMGSQRLFPLESWARGFLDAHPRESVGWELLSSALWWREDYEEASKAAAQAISAAPTDPVAYLVAARAQHRAGKLDEAVAHYSKAIEYDSGLARAYVGRGKVFFDKRELDLALEDFTKAIKLNPQYAEAYNGRGMAYYSKADHTRAIADYDQAIKLNPRLAEAWFNRGKAYTAAGRLEKALESYRQFIRLAPEVGLDDQVREAQQELDELGAR
jgi:tetratricopeptide (TPR) repeat protein